MTCPALWMAWDDLGRLWDYSGKPWEDMGRFWNGLGCVWDDLERFWDDLGPFGMAWSASAQLGWLKVCLE